MVVVSTVPIPYRFIALMQERNRLFAYPLERLAGEIRATGFQCSCCGTCCTRSVNGHIFLLDRDVADVKKIDSDAFEPAPDPEFCDQNGMLYVLGYAIRMKNDSRGSCWFLKNRRCRIYKRRFSGCRIYPHMLCRARPRSATGSPSFLAKNPFFQTSPEKMTLIAGFLWQKSQ